ncbi:MAG: hypothetical protein K0R65_1787 [Crocinitomicaceae bacterium]|jgi:hypothetical protein|nr:hypothetical protein [Crocinitomicaceae bacterium]
MTANGLALVAVSVLRPRQKNGAKRTPGIYISIC